MVKLTEAQVLARARGSSRTAITDLASVRNLNLWGQNLSDVSILQRLPNLEVLSLAINSLTTLTSFKNLNNLVELYLRRNNISDIREVQHIRHLPKLRVLWLSENPLADDPDYRKKTIALLPQLRKLDDRDVTERERSEAKAFGGVGDFASEENYQLQSPHSAGHAYQPSSYGGAAVSPSRPTEAASPRVRRDITQPPPRPPHLDTGREEQHLSGSGMSIVSVSPTRLESQQVGRPQHDRRDPEIHKSSALESINKSSAQPPPTNNTPYPANTNRRQSAQPVGRRALQAEPARIEFEPSIQGAGYDRPQRGPQSAGAGAVMQSEHKRRPSWLTRPGDSGTVKDRIRAAGIPAIAEAEESNEGTEDALKSKTNNILFAVLSLLKELDAPALQVVGYEVGEALAQTK